MMLRKGMWPVPEVVERGRFLEGARQLTRNDEVGRAKAEMKNGILRAADPIGFAAGEYEPAPAEVAPVDIVGDVFTSREEKRQARDDDIRNSIRAEAENAPVRELFDKELRSQFEDFEAGRKARAEEQER